MNVLAKNFACKQLRPMGSYECDKVSENKFLKREFIIFFPPKSIVFNTIGVRITSNVYLSEVCLDS